MKIYRGTFDVKFEIRADNQEELFDKIGRLERYANLNYGDFEFYNEDIDEEENYDPSYDFADIFNDERKLGL